jgi:adenylosuccinate lyase
MQNIALWNERDISHSSADRIIFADASTTLGFMLYRLKDILSSLVVNTERMAKNVSEHGAGTDSQRDMLRLILGGKSRKEAHAAMREKTQRRD